jgi:hypothetical protein
MDYAREQLESCSTANAAAAPAHAGEPTGVQAVPAAFDERRMQVRAYHFWSAMLGSGRFPDIAGLDPASAGDFGPQSVLLDFRGGIENPAVRFLGERLAAECAAPAAIRTVADVPGRTLLSRITEHYMRILANEAPVGFEAEFDNARGATVVYRGILLPFSSDGCRVDHVYGVINWKEVADRTTTDALLGQMAGSPSPSPVRRKAAAVAEWADAPIPAVSPPGELLREGLRGMTACGVEGIALDGAEFTLLLARREGGGLAILGETEPDEECLERAARRVLR